MAEYLGEITVGVREEPKRRSGIADFFIRLIKEKPLGTVGAIIVLALIFIAIFADLIAPYGMNEIHLADRLVPPNAQYIMGTDNLGRDLFSRIVYGARVSMYVGIGGSALETIVAAIIGLISGYLGGKVDMTFQRFVDAWMCFPGLVLYLSVMSIVGPGLIQLILVLGISSGIRRSRVVRSAVIGIKENVYVEAASAIGCSQLRMIGRHILPNVAAPILIIFTVSCGYMILSEATLSFLGFGIPPPTPSWGGMLSGAGRMFMEEGPWMVLWPGAVLAIVVYGLNMFGDAVRDLLDPRLRGGLGRYEGVKKKKFKK